MREPSEVVGPRAPVEITIRACAAGRVGEGTRRVLDRSDWRVRILAAHSANEAGAGWRRVRARIGKADGGRKTVRCSPVVIPAGSRHRACVGETGLDAMSLEQGSVAARARDRAERAELHQCVQNQFRTVVSGTFDVFGAPSSNLWRLAASSPDPPGSF